MTPDFHGSHHRPVSINNLLNLKKRIVKWNLTFY